MGYNAVGRRGSTGGRSVQPQTIERIESGLIAVLAITGVLVIAPGMWWFPFAAFLAFDLSMLGYLRSPAAAYVTGHVLVVDGGQCIATPSLLGV